ncbi:hypothetical protein DV736_g4376, partial [Chaetothyriales sp. CBS 134916]
MYSYFMDAFNEVAMDTVPEVPWEASTTLETEQVPSNQPQGPDQVAEELVTSDATISSTSTFANQLYNMFRQMNKHLRHEISNAEWVKKLYFDNNIDQGGSQTATGLPEGALQPSIGQSLQKLQAIKKRVEMLRTPWIKLRDSAVQLRAEFNDLESACDRQNNIAVADSITSGPNGVQIIDPPQAASNKAPIPEWRKHMASKTMELHNKMITQTQELGGVLFNALNREACMARPYWKRNLKHEQIKTSWDPYGLLASILVAGNQTLKTTKRVQEASPQQPQEDIRGEPPTVASVLADFDNLPYVLPETVDPDEFEIFDDPPSSVPVPTAAMWKAVRQIGDFEFFEDPDIGSFNMLGFDKITEQLDKELPGDSP